MERWWDSHSWRMIQTNLREIDMEDINAESFASQLKDFHATVVLLNVGGILASYDTSIAEHVKNPFLHGASLSQIIASCHRSGIKVIARMDFSKARREVYERHPDWAYRSADGQIVDYNGDVQMCICGGFQQEKSLEIIEEVLRLFPIDGLFFNMGGFKTRDYSYRYHGLCHCKNCQSAFARYSGSELPVKEDMADPIYRKYKAFQEKITKETNQRLYRKIRSIRPNLLIGGLDFVRIETKTEYMLDTTPWMYGSASVARGGSTLAESPFISNAAVDFIGFRYRHNAVGAERQTLRFEQDIANYCGLDFYVMGRLDNHLDNADFPAAREAFRYMERYGSYYQGMHTHANVLIIRNGGNDQLNEEAKGWIRVLTESHIIFGEANPNDIKESTDLLRFKCILVPALTKVTGFLAKKLDEYVCQGGTLIVSGANRFFDDTYGLYDQFPYKSFGSSRLKTILEDQISGLLRIGAEERSLFPSLRQTEILYYGSEYACCQYDESAQQFLHVIPPHPYGPPERCYFTCESTDPGLVRFPYGNGRALYIPWNVGKRFFLDGYLSLAQYMLDIMLNFANLESVEAEPFTPMVEVTLGDSLDGSRMMVHLVNGTGCFGNSYYSPVPVFDIKLKLPAPTKPIEIRSIQDGTLMDFVYEGGYVYMTVNRLDSFIAINIKLHA